MKQIDISPGFMLLQDKLAALPSAIQLLVLATLIWVVSESTKMIVVEAKAKRLRIFGVAGWTTALAAIGYHIAGLPGAATGGLFNASLLLLSISVRKTVTEIKTRLDREKSYAKQAK